MLGHRGSRSQAPVSLSDRIDALERHLHTLYAQRAGTMEPGEDWGWCASCGRNTVFASEGEGGGGEGAGDFETQAEASRRPTPSATRARHARPLSVPTLFRSEIIEGPAAPMRRGGRTAILLRARREGSVGAGCHHPHPWLTAVP